MIKIYTLKKLVKFSSEQIILFGLLENNYLVKNSKTLYTFSGIAVYHPRFFNGIEAGVKMQLLPLLNSSISKSLIKGELFKGVWSDIGTPERLKIVNNRD